MNNPIKQSIAKGLKRLRRERGVTQTALARLLGLSQAQFSKLENAQGSLTAEQFIRLLQEYSLPVSDFIPTPKEGRDKDNPSLQNALAYLGAKHLRLIPGVPAKEYHPEEVILEILIAPSSRLVTALAPVIARHVEKINFRRLAEKLKPYEIENRVWWLGEATHQALKLRLDNDFLLPPDLIRLYERADAVLERKLASTDASKAYLGDRQDEFDSELVSSQTVLKVQSERDQLAKDWHIITRIKLEDFEKALKDSE